MTTEITAETIIEAIKSPTQIVYERGLAIGRTEGYWDGVSRGILIGAAGMLLLVVAAWGIWEVKP